MALQLPKVTVGSVLVMLAEALLPFSTKLWDFRLESSGQWYFLFGLTILGAVLALLTFLVYRDRLEATTNRLAVTGISIVVVLCMVLFVSQFTFALETVRPELDATRTTSYELHVSGLSVAPWCAESIASGGGSTLMMDAADIYRDCGAGYGQPPFTFTGVLTMLVVIAALLGIAALGRVLQIVVLSLMDWKRRMGVV